MLRWALPPSIGELLATSDLPGGVVNLLTGFRKELVPTFATHTHLRAVVGVVNADERKTLALGAADSVKRTQLMKAETPPDWLAETAQSLEAIRTTLEFKTTRLCEYVRAISSKKRWPTKLSGNRSPNRRASSIRCGVER